MNQEKIEKRIQEFTDGYRCGLAEAFMEVDRLIEKCKSLEPKPFEQSEFKKEYEKLKRSKFGR